MVGLSTSPCDPYLLREVLLELALLIFESDTLTVEDLERCGCGEVIAVLQHFRRWLQVQDGEPDWD